MCSWMCVRRSVLFVPKKNTSKTTPEASRRLAPVQTSRQTNRFATVPGVTSALAVAEASSKQARGQTTETIDGEGGRKEFWRRPIVVEAK